EGLETVVLTIFETSAYVIDSFAEATITINDSSSSPKPTVTVTALDDLATETDGDVGVFLFTRTGLSTTNLTINYSISGSATPNVDFTGLTGSALIPAGQSSVSVVVTAIDDSVVETNETVIVTI